MKSMADAQKPSSGCSPHERDLLLHSLRTHQIVRVDLHHQPTLRVRQTEVAGGRGALVRLAQDTDVLPPPHAV